MRTPPGLTVACGGQGGSGKCVEGVEGCVCAVGAAGEEDLAGRAVVAGGDGLIQVAAAKQGE